VIFVNEVAKLSPKFYPALGIEIVPLFLKTDEKNFTAHIYFQLFFRDKIERTV